MLTTEQFKDDKRLARYIAREQLVSTMNDTKWQRLFKALEPISGVLDFRRKDVRENEQASQSWCHDFYHMLGGWRNIEWLDIRAQQVLSRGRLMEPIIEDKTPLLIQATREAAVAFSWREKSIRIWGYIRPGVSPNWADNYYSSH